MQLFSLNDEKQRIEAGQALRTLEGQVSDLNGPLRAMLQAEILEIRQLLPHFARGYGCHDRVVAVGRMDRFAERKTKPSPVQTNEIYDLEPELKNAQRNGFFITGGLGGFSMENGHRAAELIILPNGTAIRAYIEKNQHVAMMVPPINIYPLAVFTGRKISTMPGETFVCILQRGESITQPMEELARRIKDDGKTITGTLNGRFENTTGHVFTSASPKTELQEFEDSAVRDFFIYQNLLGNAVTGFERKLHSHAYEKTKLGARDSFGAHLHDTHAADITIGLYGIAKEVVTVHY